MSSLGEQLMDYIEKQELLVLGHGIPTAGAYPVEWKWHRATEAKINEWLDSHGEAIMNRIWRDKQRLEQQINHPMASLIKPTGEL